MSEWALALSIGPVADFIGGGRRSRDLWWGSTWLSECALEVARFLSPDASSQARLVVPTKRRVDRLLDRPRGYGARVSNRLLAFVSADDGAVVEALARSCQQQANQHLARQLQEARESVLSRGRRLQDALDKVLLTQQFETQLEAIRTGDFVEFFAAWCPLGDDTGGTIKAVHQLLDIRKSARLFQSASSEPGLRKSDLDAGRDSVLIGARVEDREATLLEAAKRHLSRQLLGVRPDEDLDAIGFTRRIAVFRRSESGAPTPALGPLPFPPLTRVAVDPWLRRAESRPATGEALGEIKTILDEASRSGEIFFTWCSPARDPEKSAEERHSSASCFPFDASALLEGGLEALEQEVRRVGRKLQGDAAVEQAKKDLRRIKRPVRYLHRVLGPPSPYYGLLVMDGDGVGRALERAKDQADLQELAGQLDVFADQAEDIVRRHFGCAFFVGGDDLAAYLPVDTALLAARELADSFSKEVHPTFLAPEEALTLSGGLVLAHAKADLRGVRLKGRELLKQVKRMRQERRGEGDGRAGGVPWLGILELPRSGSPRRCFGPLHDLVGRQLEWCKLLGENRLSLRSPRLLLELAETLQEGDGGRQLGLELAGFRLAAQRQRSETEQSELLEARLRSLESWSEVEELAHELAIAPRFHRSSLLRPEHRSDGR